ncbi:putative signal transducing protein [Sunxiuqinia sp. sy24]|uniref:putative signal transducing protein n=1 Tax=Sunxiuqinia sp. sy24 TaxID=3461495 RepID=UPI00404544C1
MMRTPDHETVVIYTGKTMDAEMVNQLLNNQGIETLISNQLMGSIAPWQVSAGGFEPVEIIINKEDEAKARQLIKEFHYSS